MNPTHPRLLAAIRDACPEIVEYDYATGDAIESFGHDIGLAEVLRTLNLHAQTGRYQVDCTGAIHRLPTKWVMSKWDLTQSLSGQTPETLDWLEKEICET